MNNFPPRNRTEWNAVEHRRKWWIVPAIFGAILVVLGGLGAGVAWVSRQTETPETIQGIGLLLLVCLYFLPTAIASQRGHRQTATITVINVFLGWTIIGWVVALAWAVSAQPGPE